MNIKVMIIIIVLMVNDLFSKQFDNVLLIINYNHAHYNSVELLKEIYEPYFEKVIFYGPKQHPDVHQFSHNKGYYSYLCITDAMVHYPNFDGYFFLHDDCIFSPWLLQNVDLSRIWFCEIPYIDVVPSKGEIINLELGANAFPRWGWWPTPWGWKAVRKAYEEMPESYKKILTENHGKNRVVAGFSDFVYIPAMYKDEFIELSTIFGKYNTFLELAIPTIVASLCSKDKVEWLKGHHSHLHLHDSYKIFKLDAHFNHPIKLSYKDNQIFIRDLFLQYQ